MARPRSSTTCPSVARSSITVIVGTSGSGKSTLLRMINRLIEPSSGRVLLEGATPAASPRICCGGASAMSSRGTGCFRIARSPRTSRPCRGCSAGRRASRRACEELLQVFQLDPAKYARALPHQLSGGQQQRVGVARALAAEPAVLLMDEPFGALDPIIRAKAQEDLLDIQRRFGTTVVLVTHDMDEAFHLGERVAVMSEGRLLQYDRPAVLRSPGPRPLRVAHDRPRRPRHATAVADDGGRAGAPGVAEGPPWRPAASLREVLSELVWSGADSALVVDADGDRARPAQPRGHPGARRRRECARPRVLRAGALALLLAFLLEPQNFAPLFAPLTQYGAPPIYDQGNLLSLALAQLGTVCLAAAASTLVAVGLGILVTRPSGANFLPLSRTLVNIGQTFPPVAVLAVPCRWSDSGRSRR